MTAVLIAVACLMFTVGYFIRSHSAAVERRLWQAGQERWIAERAGLNESIAELCERLAEAMGRDYLGQDEWLHGALRAAHAEVRPGERVENLTLQTRWKCTEDTALIGIDIGQAVAERAVLVHVTDGEMFWQQTEDIDLPPSDSPDWHAG